MFTRSGGHNGRVRITMPTGPPIGATASAPGSFCGLGVVVGEWFEAMSFTVVPVLGVSGDSKS
jgi:hypothetical protein